jgi:beta-glucanase (GH16 family)
MTRTSLAAVAVILAALVADPGTAQARSAALPVQTTAWTDAFGGALDTAYWRRAEQVDGEPLPCKSGANVAVHGGMLRLRTTPSDGAPCAAVGARVDTFEDRSFGPGTLTARIRQAPATGSWQTLWMTGDTGEFPLNGEIDIAETLGRAPGTHSMRLHSAYLDMRERADGRLARCTLAHDRPSDMAQWHTYRVTWGPEQVTVDADGRRVWTATRAMATRKGCHWPFGGRFRLIADAGVGVHSPYAGPADPAAYPVTVLVDEVSYRPAAG